MKSNQNFHMRRYIFQFFSSKNLSKNAFRFAKVASPLKEFQFFFSLKNHLLVEELAFRSFEDIFIQEKII